MLKAPLSLRNVPFRTPTQRPIDQIACWFRKMTLKKLEKLSVFDELYFRSRDGTNVA